MIGFQSNQDKYILYNLPGYPLDMLLELKYIIAISLSTRCTSGEMCLQIVEWLAQWGLFTKVAISISNK